MLSYTTKIRAIPLATGAAIVIAFVIFVMSLARQPLMVLLTPLGIMSILPIIIPAIITSAGVYSKLNGGEKAQNVVLIGVGAFLTVGYFAFTWWLIANSQNLN